MTHAAVLTGDLIGSTRAAPEATQSAMAALQIAAAQIGRLNGIDAKFTRFRGDGWQIMLQDSRFTLRATLILLAGLKASRSGLSTRISIAIGPVTSSGTKDLSDAAGKAFIVSGQNLDNMNPGAHNFQFSGHDPQTHFWQRAILVLAVERANGWSPEQAEAAAIALDMPRPSDAEAAAKMNITRQAFQSRLKGSGLYALSPAIIAFESPPEP